MTETLTVTSSVLLRDLFGDPWSLSEIFADDLLNLNDLCDDDLLNDLCAVFIGGALRDRDLDRDLERPPPRPF